MYLSDSTKEALIQVYYLFMMADGAVSDSENERFNQICKELEVNANERNKIVKHCKSLPIEQGASNLGVINQEIEKIISHEERFSFFCTNLSSKDLQVQVIWTLINLGYADNEYSPPEKRIVKFLAKRWDIEKSVMNDLVDSAETILALVRQKEWLKTTSKSYDTIKYIIEELDQNIQMMFDNIKVLISEADVIEKGEK